MRNLYWLIFASGAVLTISMGLRQSFGLYLEPISQSLNLGRETFALSMALLNLVWGFGAPIAGAVTDRYGPRLVILSGALTYAVGIYLMANASSPSSILVSGVIMGLGISGTGFTAVLGAVGRAIPQEQRSMALGLVAMGGSIGQFAALPLAHGLIAGYGWAGSLLILACLAASMALLGFAISSTPNRPRHISGETWKEALKGALTHKGFLLLTAGFWVCGFHIAFVAIHLPAFLHDKGLADSAGATALAIIGLGNIFGTYFFGWIGRRIEQRVALTGLYIARSIIFIPFLLAPLTEPVIWTLSACLGFLWLGTIPLTSGLVSTLFGPTWMSMLFGIVFFSHQVGAFTGAWLGGRIYDAFGSYDAMWWISIALGLTAAALHWPIKETPAQTFSTPKQA